MLEELLQLGWTWETWPNYSKLLGFHIGKDILEEQMVKQLQEKMKEKIGKAKAKHSSLVACIITINHLIIGALYYYLRSWAGSSQNDGHQFLWAGSMDKIHHRGKLNTITLSKEMGGLGVIFV